MALGFQVLQSKYVILPFSQFIPPPPSHRTPMAFNALIVSGSDPEISVYPTSGLLAPRNSKGTLFVATYRPTMYGKKHRAEFVVQVSYLATGCQTLTGQKGPMTINLTESLGLPFIATPVFENLML